MSRKRVDVRLDEQENDIVEQIAKRHNVSKSEVMRLALFGELAKIDERKNNSLSDDEREKVVVQLGAILGVLSDMRNQNGKLGSNVNQIAKALNSGGQGVSAYDVKAYEQYGERMGEQLENIAKELNALWHILA